MIAYLFEFSILLALFGLGYLVVLKGMTNYNFLRHYIFGSVFVSLGLPLVPEIGSSDILVYSLLLPETTITAKGIGEMAETLVQGNSLDLQGLLFFTLIGITIFFALRFIYALFQIAKIIYLARLDKKEDVTLLRSTQVETPFSFFHYVVLPEEISLEENALETIISHERLHIQFNHSLEKIFIEFFKVCFWWHPVSWLYSRELELVHEYQVDAAMTDLIDQTDYKKILLQLIINPQGPRMINPISSNIKKRLLMMNQKKIKNSPLRFICLFVALAFGSLFIHSCQQEENNQAAVKQVNTIDAQVPSQQDPYQITRVDTFITFNADTYEETLQIAESKVDVFVTPEKMPMLPGCDESLSYEDKLECSNSILLRFIYTNLLYPEGARKGGVEGMVLVKFIIDEEGYLHSKEFVKSPHYLLDNAVDRVLDKMSKEIVWIPGQQNGKNVSVQYTLPVKFKLEDK